MPIVPWIQLNHSPILQAVRDEWQALLVDDTRTEPAYQKFLTNHAGLLLPQHWNREDLVVAELRLGADHKVDFLSVKSQRSYGFVYTLIEIETPHTPPFTQGGQPNARLTHALQQIRDWKAWISENVTEAKRLFPSKQHRLYGEAHFEYMVIMGRRGDSQEHQGKRNQLSQESDTGIRSFDWFTDNMDHRKFLSFTGFSNDMRGISPEEDNTFTNPFYVAYTDVEWRKFVDSPDMDIAHMIGHNLPMLQGLRRYNNERLKTFLEYVRSLPPEQQEPAPFELRMMR